jgi:hypothetical protein
MPNIPTMARYYMKQSKIKYLGVTIDNTLSWNSHIDIITKKANVRYRDNRQSSAKSLPVVLTLDNRSFL